jgi:hypothetical protein
MAGGLGQVTLLDVTYTIDNVGGVTQFAAVVQGASDGSCALPGGANVAGFLGFAKTSQAKQNKGVNVARLGIARAIAAGAISRGDRVQIADNQGRVQSAEAAIVAVLQNPAANVNVIGRAENTVANAGDIVYVFINEYAVSQAVS